MITLDATGLQIQTFDEIFEEIVGELQTALTLTNAQAQRIRTSTLSTLGQLARLEASREQRIQEGMAALYNTLSIDASGANLDRVVRLLGVTRDAAANSRVLGEVTGGTPATAIPDGTRYQYLPTGDVFRTDGAVVLDGSGEYVDLPLVADSDAAIVVALSPDTDADEWQLLDVIVGAGDFESTEQPIVGHPIDGDAQLRVEAATEAFRRGIGPLLAINAAVQEVEGVTYVRAFDNPTEATDVNGIPPWSVNLVVRGGSDLDVANAYWTARAAGANIFALVDGSEVSQVITDEYEHAQTVEFNRVADVDIYVEVTATTSTSEETAPTDLSDVIEARILERAGDVFGIGIDVVTYKIVTMLSGIAGIDAIAVRLSLDGVSWSTAKREISIRQQAAFEAANITVIVN